MPHLAVAYTKRGVEYNELGNYQHALLDFSQAIALNPNDALAYAHRGVAHGALNNYAQAIRDYDRA